MKKLKLNICVFIFFGIFSLILAKPIVVLAQSDSVSFVCQDKLVRNISELNTTFIYPDLNSGKFRFANIEKVKAEYEKIHTTVFPGFYEKANKYYKKLENLNRTQKQNLVQTFSYYEPFLDAAFQKEKLPAELKYLAPALSGMNMNYVNNGKAGIWQMTHFQAILNGIQINKLIDERFNIFNSNLAAAHEIKQNYLLFKDYNLAVIAFLVGKTKVRNRLSEIEKSDSEFNVETAFSQSLIESIAAFQAMTVFLSNNKFKETLEPLSQKNFPDTVEMNRQLHFKQISEVLAIHENELSFLNPQYKFLIVPGDKYKCKLILPKGKRDDFIIWQDSIYNTFDSSLFEVVSQKIEYAPAPNRQYLGEPVKDLEIEGKTKIQYRIKSGDVLGIIAEKYDVRVADLKYWNNIYNERKIQAGQKMDIFVDTDKTDFYRNLEATVKSEKPVEIVQQFKMGTSLKVLEELEKSSNKIEHIVKSGESPFIIAKKYEGVSPEEILEWNGIDDPRKIQIGQKLIVYLKK